jgi:hypothetical protein
MTARTDASGGEVAIEAHGAVIGDR